jgi:WD40 repeat protein
MNHRSALVIALVLSVLSIARAESRPLEFVKQIGVPADGWLSFVSFSADGSMVAADGQITSDVSGDLAFWTFPGGQLIKRLPILPEAMSRDWKYYASFHGIGEVGPESPLISLPKEMFAIHAFSPDSHYVAESSFNKGARTSIRIIELATGKQVNAFARHDTQSLAVSPDGHTLASGNWDIITLWNMFTGKRLAVLRGFGRYVDSISFNNDGTLLAAGTDTGSLQIWDVRRQRRIESLEIGGGFVSTPAFSPDGRLAAVGIYGTGSVWLIDIGSGKILDHQKVSDIGCGSVAFSPDGHFLITPSTGGLVTWPYDRGGTIRVFKINDH